MNMNEQYIEAAKKFIEEGYCSEDIDKLAKKFMMLTEDAEAIRDEMINIERSAECTDTE